MVRFETEIPSSLPPEQAFAYMASFEHCADWDPGVVAAARLEDGPLRPGSAFRVVARFAGRTVPLRYAIVELDAPRHVVIAANGGAFTSRDTIGVGARDDGSSVSYAAELAFRGLARLFEPLAAIAFRRVCAKAEVGLQRCLNP